MAKESLQKKVGRVRPPRVQISYDVETGGATEKREIAFVAGVLADLSGDVDPAKPLPPIGKRKFVEVDRDNFDSVLKKTGPRLTLKVNNRLQNDDTKLSLELNFGSLDDFTPAQVAKQVPALRKLLELRSSLQNLRSSMIGNEKLESILEEVMKSTEAAQRIGAETIAPAASAQTPDAGKE